MLLGDFNLPSLAWDSDNLFDNVYIHPTDRLETFLSLGLTQFVRQSTFPRSGNILDLILATDPDRVGMIEVFPPLPGCDHCPTLCDYLFESFSPPSTCSPSLVRKWHKGKYKRISSSLDDINWDFEFSSLNVQSAYRRLLELVTPLINEYVPLRDSGSDYAQKPWKTNARLVYA